MRLGHRTAVLDQVGVRLVAVLVVVCAFFGSILVDATSAAGTVQRIPYLQPQIPGSQIACFDKKTRSEVGKIEPWHCEFAGRVEFAGYPGRRSEGRPLAGSLVRIPVEGPWERIEWTDWGEGKAWSVEAVGGRSRDDLILNAYRRVRCPDGSTWYSRIDIYNTQGGHEFRLELPICGKQNTPD